MTALIYTTNTYKLKEKHMAKTKKQTFDFKLACAIVCAAIVGAVIGAAALRSDTPEQPKSTIHTSLGALAYSFDHDRATKRTDAGVTDIQKFLEAEGRRSGCGGPVYHNVMAANEDETQLLLNYGCGYPNARMFAQLENGKWRTISPTNQFDVFGIPRCEHVTENHIAVRIAPVCTEDPGANGIPTYIVR